MRALGFLLLAIFCSCWLFLPLSASAASVTVTNNVVISNAYGKLTAVGNNVEDSFAVYPNGTIFWNVSTQYAIQLTYTFTAQSYGNGTFTVRFKAPVPPSTVQTGGHLAGGTGNTQDILYAVGDSGYGKTGVLIVSYVGIGHVLRDAAFILAMFTPIILAVGFARWSSNFQDPNRIEKMKKLYMAALTLSLGTALLFIMSTLFPI